MEYFFNIPCSSIQISIDVNEIIESMSINFPLILDRLFYDETIRIYGFSDSILATDNLISESKSENSGEDGFKQNLAKRVYSMKEVSFDNKPFFILWNKENYQIKMTFYYEQNGTQLIFRKPTDRF